MTLVEESELDGGECLKPLAISSTSVLIEYYLQQQISCLTSSMIRTWHFCLWTVGIVKEKRVPFTTRSIPYSLISLYNGLVALMVHVRETKR